MKKQAIAWVVEFRYSPHERWRPEEVYETRAEAKKCGWRPIPPAEQRIVKYVREE